MVTAGLTFDLMLKRNSDFIFNVIMFISCSRQITLEAKCDNNEIQVKAHVSVSLLNHYLTKATKKTNQNSHILGTVYHLMLCTIVQSKANKPPKTQNCTSTV